MNGAAFGSILAAFGAAAALGVIGLQGAEPTALTTAGGFLGFGAMGWWVIQRLWQRLDSIEDRLREAEGRLFRLESRVAEVDGRMTRMEVWSETVNRRLERLEESI